MRIAINTGGGDAPGLNAAIRSATLAAIRRGWDVFGIRNGYGSLFTDTPFIPLDASAVRGITMRGGTILGTANRGNPFQMPDPGDDGKGRLVDRSDEVIRRFKEHGIDVLVAIGGDGSMRIANRMRQKGIRVVGVPKTIDNDIWGCDVSLGFDTAVTTATEAIDKLTTTAESHQRIMVIEVMGRHAGWIALHAGMAASADTVLIPEIPFSLDAVARHILRRYEDGQAYSLVVVAEGAHEQGRDVMIKGQSLGQSPQLGGIADHLADRLGALTGNESRSIVLGHLQRGGTPSPYDRLISLRFGAEAIRAIEEQDFDKLVVMRENRLIRIPIAETADRTKTVPLDSDTVRTAREIGIELGEPGMV